MKAANPNQEELRELVRELCKLPHELEWLEFKLNNTDPQQIGEYISALSNAAALNGRVNGYLLWGVADGSHDLVGSSFDPWDTRKGNEPLESWLLRLLRPKIQFRFLETTLDGARIVILEVGHAYRHPVSFSGVEFIRIGEVKKPLKDAPDRERELWRALDQEPFEDMISAERLSPEEVIRAIDFKAYFELLSLPTPGSVEGILEALSSDRLIRRSDSGGWDISNLGAALFLERMEDVRGMARKAVRVIQYHGCDRIETKKEQLGHRGYASGFEGLIGYINALLPENEVIGDALRQSVRMFPQVAIRELVANALIHQDFLVSGAGPMVEIFDDRIEITNPGEPLVDTQRFLDHPPRSRNESLAALMRRFGICEERGSGIDKVLDAVELFQLPAPLFEAPSGFTRATLFAHKDLPEMTKEDRVRACYMHAALRFVNRKSMTNSSLRKRFGIADKNASLASRLIKEGLDAGVIVLQDPNAGSRARAYLPYWAGPGPDPTKSS